VTPPYECENGKLAHPTEADALRHRAGLRKAGDPRGHRLKVYPCGSHWHVGHRTPRRKAPKTRTPSGRRR
jgi:hypothetical protein